MQFLARDQNTPGRNIGAGVGRFKVAIAPVMRRTIDDAGGHHRRPHHLHRPHSQPGNAKQCQVDQQHDHNAHDGKPAVQIAFDPVIGRTVTKTRHGFLVDSLLAVQLVALQQHRFDAVNVRAVRIVGLLALGVVLAVDRCPLLSDLASGQPQPKAEKMCGNRMQVQRAMRLMPV